MHIVCCDAMAIAPNSDLVSKLLAFLLNKIEVGLGFSKVTAISIIPL